MARLDWNSASQVRQVIPAGVFWPANTPPQLAPVANATLFTGQTLSITNRTVDGDLPAQTLTYSLATAPVDANLDAGTGILRWRPTMAQSPSTNLFSIAVTDSGQPPLSATQSFWATVVRPAPPLLQAGGTTSQGFRLHIDGVPGPDYQVYGCTNLNNNWQWLGTTNPASLPFDFVDPGSSNAATRFYRIQLGP
ncbi:MAG TPA: hypothetical protein VF607_05145 [Verrucomicrobiae bacterium]